MFHNQRSGNGFKNTCLEMGSSLSELSDLTKDN